MSRDGDPEPAAEAEVERWEAEADDDERWEAAFLVGAAERHAHEAERHATEAAIQQRGQAAIRQQGGHHPDCPAPLAPLAYRLMPGGSVRYGCTRCPAVGTASPARPSGRPSDAARFWATEAAIDAADPTTPDDERATRQGYNDVATYRRRRRYLRQQQHPG